MDVLDRLGLLGERGGEGVEPDRPAFELEHDRLQQAPVERLQADLVNLQEGERVPGGVHRGTAVAPDLRVVPDPAEQPVGDARRAASATGDLRYRVSLDLDLQDPRGRVRV